MSLQNEASGEIDTSELEHLESTKRWTRYSLGDGENSIWVCNACGHKYEDCDYSCTNVDCDNYTYDDV